jgi:hydroxymethylglutaryl-CoA reductase
MIGAVGIAQNFAALRALVGDGIQRGHMRLHARSVAASVGVSEEQFDDVVNEMLATGDVKAWKAEELLAASKFDLGGSATNAEEPWPGAGQGIAAGKVILLGEHAAVYDKHVLALPLSEAVVAQIMEHVSVTSLTVFEEESVAQIDLSMTGKSGFAAVLSLIMRRLKLDPLYFTIRIRSKIPAAMGLGSSAAFSVAIIRAFDDLFDLGLDDLRVNQLAFDCEKITHGSPSGIDNNLATFAEPVLFSKSNATRTRPLKLIEPPPLVVASSGVSANTLDQVAGVRVRYKRDPALYDMIFNEIDEMSLAGAEALRLRDYETLGALMNVCHGMLNAIEVSTPELEKMIQIARQKGAVGAKLTGSGGGGSIVALCPGREEEVAAGLRQAGFRVIRLGTAATRQ